MTDDVSKLIFEHLRAIRADIKTINDKLDEHTIRLGRLELAVAGLRRPESAGISPAVPSVPVGKIKSFGPFGPKYEVGQPLRQLDDKDWMVEVIMVETGEKTEYRLTHLVDDPEAH